jgi:hypothetical protein
MQMNDPSVSVLRYRLVTRYGISYNDPPAIEHDFPDYRLKLDKGVLSFRMKSHYATVDCARAAVQGYLRAWELQTLLDSGSGRLNFEFDGAQVIDRDPPPGTHVHVSGVLALALTGHAEVRVSIGRYPGLPGKFLATPLVEMLSHRYQLYLEGKDILTTTGYFCLSALQEDAGGRKAAAAKYKIALGVLDKLGELTSDVGDPSTARKLDRFSQKRPHTGKEKTWVVEAVKILIKRVAEDGFNRTARFKEITMADLPLL